MARYVIPHLSGMLDRLRSSYEMVVRNKRSYGKPVMAAISKAFADAGKELPDDLNPATLR